MAEVIPKGGDYSPSFPLESRVLRGFEEPRKRSSTELTQLLEERDRRKQKKDILDESGRKLCVIEYDPETNDIISIQTEPYKNTEETAEHLEEKIYVTDDKGEITPERLTRAEARIQERRYLIVTNLLFRGDNMLIQKRSPNKKIDPGKISASAHGVAKEIFSEDRLRIINTQTAALINTALEINEELRHDSEPFAIRIWPGRHDELLVWAKEQGLDDPNTIWIIPEAYFPDDGYPLGSIHNKRTRALSAGFVFSDTDPLVSIDPSELEGYTWEKVSKVFKEPQAADDLTRTTITVVEEALQDSPLVRRYGQKLAENLLRRYQGLPVEKP